MSACTGALILERVFGYRGARFGQGGDAHLRHQVVHRAGARSSLQRQTPDRSDYNHCIISSQAALEWAAKKLVDKNDEVYLLQVVPAA